MKKKNYKKIKLISSFLFLVFVLITYFLRYYNPNIINTFIGNESDKIIEYDQKLSVHFLNVGKADCAFIHYKTTNILIDAGDKETNFNVAEYLKRENVSKFDLVVATHPHRDHIGQMEDVINEFKIDKFLMSKCNDKDVSITPSYKAMLKALDKKNINVQFVKPYQEYYFEDIKITILAPLKIYDKINNNSVVLRLEFGNHSFIFMGDAEKEAENDIVKNHQNLRSTVLKIGHHGSKTSTSQIFLDAIAPKYAVISVGPDRNNLPKELILNRLTRANVKILRTDLHGNIVFLTDGNNIEIVKENEV